MTYPASIVTRPVQLGGAISVEEGRELTIRMDTTASRALVHQLSGTRLEKVMFESRSFFAGEPVWWDIAATDQSNTYLDAETRQAIILGPDEHTHLYTTTLTILDRSEVVSEYTIGPYPVPAGEGILDLDRHLIPPDTTEGTLVPIPQQWAQTIDNANAIVELRGQPEGIATLDDQGVVPPEQLPDVATNGTVNTALQTLRDDVDADFDALPGELADNDSALRAPLDALYPVRLLWDPVSESYPARVPGAVNIFLGPVNPGLAMDPDMDRWDSPDGTTIDEVISEVQRTAAPLRAAVRNAAAPDTVEFTAMDFAAVDNRPPTLGTMSPAANLAMGVPVLLFGDNQVQVAGVPWRTPVGWSACRVYVDWVHTVSPINTSQVNWQARIAGYANGTDLSVTPGLQTLAQIDNAPGAVRTIKRFLIPGSFGLNPAGAEVRLAISRLATTFGGPVGLIKMILERTA